MAVSSLEELHSERSSDIDPLLMERLENDNDNEHIIDMSRMGDSSSSSTSHDRPSDVSHIVDQEGRNSSSVANPVSQPLFFSSTASNSGNSSFTRRGSGSRRRRNPLNSGLWISVELVLTLSQIVASIVVLSLSRHERPHSPLFAWIVGYASGCVAILPLLCWRYYHQNQHSEQNLLGPHHPSRQNNLHTGESTVSVAVNGTLEGENGQINRASTRNGQEVRRVHLRPKALVEYFKLALDCFFAVWFVIGNVWVFGGHSSASDAPNLYRLCIVFLVFSCIGYAMPFILCATICCCLPCIISILGFREDLVQTRGATAESINSLPTYKFKAARNRNGDDSPGAGECGFVASGTEKERAISGDDAVCCICLANYLDDEELRELPCSHLFHKECVDKWLKINASCPLCKCEVGERVPESPSGTSVGRGEGQGENGSGT